MQRHMLWLVMLGAPVTGPNCAGPVMYGGPASRIFVACSNA